MSERKLKENFAKEICLLGHQFLPVEGERQTNKEWNRLTNKVLVTEGDTSPFSTNKLLNLVKRNKNFKLDKVKY
jgi:hypothetical protein